MSKFSQSIKKHRNANNLTQLQLAQKLFVTKQAVSKWETGRGYPDTSSLPSIANILDISIDDLLGEDMVYSKKSYLKVILLSTIITVLFASIIITSVISLKRKYNVIQEINEIEDLINYDLPNQGIFVTSNFEDWMIYGNTLPVASMSYIIFTNDNKIQSFEENIRSSDIWTNSFSETLLLLVPEEISDYTTIGDYYMLCNTTLLTYNELYNEFPDNSDSNYYILLIYQEENNRLVIFEYSIQYNGGYNEN